MKYNIFDEKNIILVNLILASEGVDNPYMIASYHSEYDKYFPTKEAAYSYINEMKLKCIGTYTFHFYNMQSFDDYTDGYGFGVGMKNIVYLSYLKNKVVLGQEDLCIGNRYLLEDKTIIIFLGYLDGKYHYIPFEEYRLRMDTGRLQFEYDDPRRLRKKKIYSYKRLPHIIGDLGPYWNNKVFYIRNNKIESKDE